MANFERFHREALGVRGFENVSNYSMGNYNVSVVTYEAVTLFHMLSVPHIPVNFLVYSSLLYKT